MAAPNAPLTLFSVQCAVCIIQCAGVTLWFPSVAVHREEDLLDLAPFLADNSRLGERIVITESARMIHQSSLPSLPSHPSLPSPPIHFSLLSSPLYLSFPSPPLHLSLPLPSLSPLTTPLPLPSLSPLTTPLPHMPDAGCQIILTKELDGLVLRLPRATRNFYVDGHTPQAH